MKPMSWSSATYDQCLQPCLKGDYLGRLTTVVRRMDVLQAWRHWGVKALGNDDLG
ncbi:hypothetical protein A2U01_0051554, partial [Trifolium medium]|nr:hypothetical protein [Trifolium medium]